jgi:hypothetical protein
VKVIDEFMDAIFADKPDGMIYHAVQAFFQEGDMTMDLVWPFMVLGGESGNEIVRGMLQEDIVEKMIENVRMDQAVFANKLFEYGSRGDVTDKGRKWVYAMSKLVADAAGIEVFYMI